MSQTSVDVQLCVLYFYVCFIKGSYLCGINNQEFLPNDCKHFVDNKQVTIISGSKIFITNLWIE